MLEPLSPHLKVGPLNRYSLLTVNVWLYIKEIGAVKMVEDERVTIIKGVRKVWKEEDYKLYFR